jgi:CheY-like chemotaxis protein
VISAADGQQALDVFDSQTVDLVLLDYLMPGMNGGAVAQEMKTRNPNVSVMIVSASPVSEATLNCADCRIYKGQGPALLLEKIRQLLSRGVKAHAAVTTDTANDGGARRNKI